MKIDYNNLLQNSAITFAILTIDGVLTEICLPSTSTTGIEQKK